MPLSPPPYDQTLPLPPCDAANENTSQHRSRRSADTYKETIRGRRTEWWVLVSAWRWGDREKRAEESSDAALEKSRVSCIRKNALNITVRRLVLAWRVQFPFFLSDKQKTGIYCTIFGRLRTSTGNTGYKLHSAGRIDGYSLHNLRQITVVRATRDTSYSAPSRQTGEQQRNQHIYTRRRQLCR